MFADWNYPLLPMIWSIVNLALPGPAGMLLLFLVLYWAALFILADALATLDARAAFAMPVFGLSPFAINFVRTIWTDVLLALCWLMAMALVFSGRIRDGRLSIPRQAAAWTFFLWSLGTAEHAIRRGAAGALHRRSSIDPRRDARAALRHDSGRGSAGAGCALGRIANTVLRARPRGEALRDSLDR